MLTFWLKFICQYFSFWLFLLCCCLWLQVLVAIYETNIKFYLFHVFSFHRSQNLLWGEVVGKNESGCRWHHFYAHLLKCHVTHNSCKSQIEMDCKKRKVFNETHPSLFSSRWVNDRCLAEESVPSFIVLFWIRVHHKKWNKALWGWSCEMTMIFLQLGMVSVYARRSSPNKVMKLPRDKSISISWSSWLSTLPGETTPCCNASVRNVN